MWSTTVIIEGKVSGFKLLVVIQGVLINLGLIQGVLINLGLLNKYDICRCLWNYVRTRRMICSLKEGMLQLMKNL